MIQTLGDTVFKRKHVTVDVLRLDLIHPEVSGNKWFKLKYHLTEAIQQKRSGLLSFGGAYSNHLVALAFVAYKQGFQATAIIRGEEPKTENRSLAQMKAYGMNLVFVSRDDYRNKEEIARRHIIDHPHYYYVPEGGQSELGIKGASEILLLANKPYSHILCAVGTGTTMAGILSASASSQKIIGISSLKAQNEERNSLLDLMQSSTTHNNYKIIFDYHFGGYARKTDELISFMNSLHKAENIPTDFVYTGKLFYALYKMAQQNYFSEGSNILVIHTGGLQGNRSLPEGLLDF